MNSKRARTLTLVVAVLLVVGAIASKVIGGGGGSNTTTTGASSGTVDVPSGAIRVDFVISPGPDVLLAKPLQEFNDQKVEINGKRVVVVPQTVSSGAALDAMRAKTLKPTLVAGLLALGPAVHRARPTRRTSSTGRPRWPARRW